MADLKEGLKRTDDIEKKIISGRLTGQSFCELEANDLASSVDQIMLRGAAISGSALPNTDFFADIIASEIENFINECGYRTLTVEEILNAMRLNSKSELRPPGSDYVDRIPFSGNCFNVDYLARILVNYMRCRDWLDRRFQNLIDGYEK